jgi:uncharacterized protein (DUF305 family)
MRSTALLLAIGLLGLSDVVRADDMAGMKMGASPADKALNDSMKTMMKDMHAKPTGDADADFVAMMLPHH